MKLSISKSQHLLVYLIVVHLMAVFLLLMTLQIGLVLFTCVSLAIASFAYYCWQFGWLFKQNRQLESLSIDEKSHWHLNDAAENREISCDLYKARVLPMVIFLYFKGFERDKSQTVIVMRDAVCVADWRKLRAYLKCASFLDE